MSTTVRWFLRSAVAWLVLGMGLGIWMGAAPERIVELRPAHLHAVLPGFVLMMIFGVAYHILPRFSGRPVPWARGPSVHLALANVGLLVTVPGFLLRVRFPEAGRILVPLGGSVMLLGACFFVHTVWSLTERPKWNPRAPGATSAWTSIPTRP